MKQIFQALNNGKTELVDVPCPQVKPGCLLIQSHTSLISNGTERTVVELAKANLLVKAKQQPERVKEVFEKAKTDGLLATFEAVKDKLDKPIPLGYSNAGVILKVGNGVTGFNIGERVVSNGPHAEVVCVPKNLCAKIPAQVSDEAAAFTVIAAIGLQGVRLLQPTLGERIVVIGLGLVGLLVVQILRAHGCRVLGVDFDPHKLELAQVFGAEIVNLAEGADPVAHGINFSNAQGVDGVLITAATQSSEPIHQAAQMCRKRGRIILVGVTGLELFRNDFYQKELTFQVSCSYGPGRYDLNYEEKGQDYPFGFVRWTEQRNFEAVLEMMAEGRLNTSKLLSERFPFNQALAAYDLICQSSAPLGILLQYSGRDQESIWNQTISLSKHNLIIDSQGKTITKPTIAMIGAGEFATRMFLPALRKARARLKTIASLSGLSGMYAGRKFGFETVTTDLDVILNDPQIDTVFIMTRHQSHAELVCKALKAGKQIFVEKPLALNEAQLIEIKSAYAENVQNGLGSRLLVGFNRRFAPQVIKIKQLLKTVKEPKSMVMMVNAGAIALTHWVHDPESGGGRIIGEACHFIDLLRFLVDSPIKNIQVSGMGLNYNKVSTDNLSFILSFADGSVGTIHYFANGHRSFPKERLEVFCAGRILQLNNFKTLTGYGWPGFKRLNLRRQDKGHLAEIKTFLETIQTGKPSPINFEELIEVTEASFAVVASIGSDSNMG